MSHRKAMALAFALAASPVAVLAQSPANPDSAAVQGGSYKIDPLHTQVIFTVSHFGFVDFSGFFHNASGELQLSPTSLTATKVDITIPAASVLTTVDDLTGELKGEHWLDAAKYPDVTFHSNKVTRTGPNTADVAGDLTLHGVTKPIVLKTRFIGAGVNPIDKTYTAGFEATCLIKRTEFGVSTYAPLIGDQVTLTIAASVHKPNS